MDRNIAVYRRYTKWLESLPEADECGERRVGRFTEPVFTIAGQKGKFVLGDTGYEQEDSVVASLSAGNLLKARVFNPVRKQ